MEFALFGVLVLLVILVGLIWYESRQIKNYEKTFILFVESNSELFGVVNANATVAQAVAEKVDSLEKNIEFFKIILDAHAHALRVYAPFIENFEPPLSDKIKTFEE